MKFLHGAKAPTAGASVEMRRTSYHSIKCVFFPTLNITQLKYCSKC